MNQNRRTRDRLNGNDVAFARNIYMSQSSTMRQSPLFSISRYIEIVAIVKRICVIGLSEVDRAIWSNHVGIETVSPAKRLSVPFQINRVRLRYILAIRRSVD